MRVSLDANVLFNAAYQDRSDVLIFFDLARARRIELTSSAFAIDEARHNLALKRPDRVADCERPLAEIALAPAPAAGQLAIAEAAGLATKDIPILASGHPDPGQRTSRSWPADIPILASGHPDPGQRARGRGRVPR